MMLVALRARRPPREPTWTLPVALCKLVIQRTLFDDNENKDISKLIRDKLVTSAGCSAHWERGPLYATRARRLPLTVWWGIDFHSKRRTTTTTIIINSTTYHNAARSSRRRRCIWIHDGAPFAAWTYAKRGGLPRRDGVGHGNSAPETRATRTVGCEFSSIATAT